MDSHKLYMLAMFLVVVGALNWGSVGALKVDLVQKLLGNGDLAKLVYLLVGIAAIYLLSDVRNLYLPFLGETVMPVKVFAESTPAGANVTTEVDAENAVKVVYWASMPKSSDKLTGPQEAYGDFSNSGVVAVVNGKAKLSILCPQEYKVGVTDKKLNKHVHYRLVNANGMLSEVKTKTVEC
uniref:DUF378 domain-containing protein n=1 Tax=viral metagenome TaxID=1070528 RepID=A0A6C0EC42_9ZZZZ